MSLFNCPECSREISTTCQSCPQCGWVNPAHNTEPTQTTPSPKVQQTDQTNSSKKKHKSARYWFTAILTGTVMAIYIISSRGGSNALIADHNELGQTVAEVLKKNGVSGCSLTMSQPTEPYEYSMSLVFGDIAISEETAKKLSYVAIQGAIPNLVKQGILPNEMRVYIFVHIVRTKNGNPIEVGMGTYDSRNDEFIWETAN